MTEASASTQAAAQRKAGEGGGREDAGWEAARARAEEEEEAQKRVRARKSALLLQIFQTEEDMERERAARGGAEEETRVEFSELVEECEELERKSESLLQLSSSRLSGNRRSAAYKAKLLRR